VQKKAHVWSLNNWIVESQARTQEWRSGRYNQPVAWIFNEGKSIPHDAIQGGEERGERLYICRAYHEVCTYHAIILQLLIFGAITQGGLSEPPLLP
jgi:hypothetical protein